MVGILISFIAIIMLSFAIYSLCNIKSGYTPLISITTLMAVAVIFALFGQLNIGVGAAYCFAFALFIYAVIKRKNIRGFFTPSVIIFIGFSLCLGILLYSKNPILNYWDEFSFWGTAAKLIKENGALYTFYKSSMLGNSIPPFLPLLTYFFGWSFNGFCEWGAFFAYDVLILSAFCSVCAHFEEKKKYVTPLLFSIMFFLPFFFEAFDYTVSLVGAYATLYSEMPIAVLFGGRLVTYFGTKEENQKALFFAIPQVFALTLSKDMGFALGCIVRFVIFFDIVVAKKGFTFYKIKGIFAKIFAGATMLMATVIPYAMWAFHRSKVIARGTPVSSGDSVSLAGMLIEGAKELLGLSARSQKFIDILSLMTNAFFHARVSAIGSLFVLCILVFAIFAIAFFCAEKGKKAQVVTAYITMLIGFVGYYVFHLFLYVFIFKDDAYYLPSYNRYMYPYIFAWIMVGIIMLAKADSKIKGAFVTLALMFMMAGIYTSTFKVIKVDNTVFSANETLYADRLNLKTKADNVKDVINPQDVILVFVGDNDGYDWFVYSYELSQNYIVQMPNIDASQRKSEEEKTALYRKQLSDFMREKGVTHILVSESSHEFDTRCMDLFDVSLSTFGLNSIGYFKVNYENDSFTCSIVNTKGY